MEFCRFNSSSFFALGPRTHIEEDFELILFQAGVERANSRAVSNVANIKKWTVLPRWFTLYT